MEKVKTDELFHSLPGDAEGDAAPRGTRGPPAPRGGPRGGPALPKGGPPKVAEMVQNVGVKPEKKMKPFHWNKLRGTW